MAYGKYRHSSIYGEKGTTWNVEIWKDNFSGTSSEINLSGEGFEITWNGQGGTRDRVFLGSECKLNLFVENNTDESFIYDTINSGYKEYFVRIYKGTVQNSNLWWYGFVQPAFDKIENLPFPYVFQLTATDSYGFWDKQKDKFFNSEAEKNAPHKIRDILFTIAEDMDLNILGGSNLAPIPTSFNWLRTSLDWWSSPHTYQSDDPAILYHVAKGFVSKPTTYDDDNNIETDQDAFQYKPAEVFKGVLKSFNTVGFLAEGHYNFIQPNNYANNTTGVISVYEYNSGLISNPSNPFNLNTLLTIDQSNNVILGGSSITYEPAFESVKVNHNGGFSNFQIGSGQFLNNSFLAGSIQSGLIGEFQLNFFAKYYERVAVSDFSFNVAPGTLASNYSVNKASFLTTGSLTIYITDGNNYHWLKQTEGSNILTWQNTSTSISIERGYAADTSLPVNDPSYMAVGLVSNIIFQTGGPCSTNITVSNNQQFYTNIIFNAIVEQPPISGDVYIQLTCDNDYYQIYNSPVAGDPIVFGNLNDPTPGATAITCEDITLIPTDNNEDNDVTNGIIYTATQTNNTALEQFDLGEVNLGQSSVNHLHSFQYLSGSIYEVVPGFRRGNTGSYINASQLLANEFLQFQVDPLEILQADIQSSNISPLKLIKYSINNDSNFKYYTFLGGTFKAQSEILSGEWFEVNSITSNITGGTTPDGPTPQPPTPTILGKVNQQNLINNQTINNNSYGKIAAALSNGTTDTKVTLSAASKGKIYSGQKLVLTYPDGSNPLTLTASGDSTTSDTQIDLSSFTLNISYPVGSILGPLLYDFTNVITTGGTPGGSDTQVQFNDGGSFGGTSLMTVGTDKITFTGNVEIQGSNEKIKLNSGGDIVLDDDVNGGSGSGGLLYRDSGGGLKFAFVVHPSNIVTICNRAANGEVQIRANTATAGASGELVIATFKDTSVDFLQGAELRGTNIGNIFDLTAYLTPVNFIMTNNQSYESVTAHDGGASELNNASASSYATFQVPKGYRATHVQVNGSSSSSTFDVYSCDITDNSATAQTSSPAVNTNQALTTAQAGEAGKYLSIKFTPGATRRTVLGAKITLERF